MAVSIQTNKGSVFGEPKGPKHADFGYVIVTADADGDKAYLPGHSLWKNGIEVGPTFQASSGCTIALTLDPAEFASKPANDTLVLWKTWNTFVAGDIVACPLMFSVARITFAVKGRVTVISL